MTIPTRIIQTGKSRNLPPFAKASAANMKLLHVGWDFCFFDDSDVQRFVAEEFPEYQQVFDGFFHPIQRFDFFRYLAVYRLGGFYFDLDVFLWSDLSPLVDSSCVFPFEELTLSRYLRKQHGIDWEIGNYAFGAEPGQPFVKAVIDNCVRAQRDPAWVKPLMEGIPWPFQNQFYVVNTTGPGLVSRTLAENPELRKQVTVLFPENVCDETTWHRFGDFGIHLMNASWRNRDGFIRARLARLWENHRRRRLMQQSMALGSVRSGEWHSSFPTPSTI